MSRAIVFLTRAFIVYCWVLALHYAMHAQIVDNPSKTGVQQESIYRTLDFISNNLDASCTATLPMAKDMILLHELGHATNAPGFVPDYGNPSKVDHNDSLITNGCKNVVKSAGKFKGAL